MNASAFETNNQTFLKAALEWLRLLLQSRTPAVEEKPKPWWCRRRKHQRISAKKLITARQTMDDAAQADPKPAFSLMADKLNLSEFDKDMLLLAAAMEIDPDLPALIAAWHHDHSRHMPTLALGLSIFDQEKRESDALSSCRPLRKFQLLEVHQTGGASLLTANLRIDEYIAGLIKGETTRLDERLLALLFPLPPAPSLPASQAAIACCLERWLSAAKPVGIVQLTGADTASKRDIMAASSALSGRQVMSVAADTLPTLPDEFDTFVKLWQRESRLAPLILYIEGMEPTMPMIGEDRAVTASNPRLIRNLRRIGEPVVIDTRNAIAELEGSGIIEIKPPTEKERRELWLNALALRGVDVEEKSVARLAGEFTLASSRIEENVEQAVYGLESHHLENGPDCVDRAWQCCISRGAADIEGLAERIEPKAKLEDIKLPPHGKAELERLVQHARHRSTVISDFGFGAHTNRGLGLAALFCGESGTGKTMAAEAIAGALGLPLFRIDSASLISKYYGETEKNIRRIFEAAEAGGAVCFFDECDSFSSRRVEANDSHDHFLNVQINYLLTRMDSFTGVAILATNMKQALDPAFLRRTRYVIEFPFPGAEERKAIWQSVFPQETPVGYYLDYDRLSRFTLSGGNIHNAALAAAHSAAAEDKGENASVEMPHILEAIRTELIKIGRPGSNSDFLWTPPTSEDKQGKAA
ncbi:ATP-binding protein [Methylobacter marinus]|uniref:ATP-binding protein n=1 Tax=Methylobacter marinus TaxID=34058 RepID=UPI000368588A|nr:AAA family ATPase [Methylobacter marinus]